GTTNAGGRASPRRDLPPCPSPVPPHGGVQTDGRGASPRPDTAPAPGLRAGRGIRPGTRQTDLYTKGLNDVVLLLAPPLEVHPGPLAPCHPAPPARHEPPPAPAPLPRPPAPPVRSL